MKSTNCASNPLFRRGERGAANAIPVGQTARPAAFAGSALSCALVALFATACGGGGGEYVEQAESETVVNDEAALESGSPCPALNLSVADVDTGETTDVYVPAENVAATLTDEFIVCQPKDNTYVSSRGLVWSLENAYGETVPLQILNHYRDGSTVTLVYLSPADFATTVTETIGCREPPEVTASAPLFGSATAKADLVAVNYSFDQAENGGTLWQVQCNFYISGEQLGITRERAPEVPPSDGPIFPDLDFPPPECAPEEQCSEDAECGVWRECRSGCCGSVIR